MYSLPHRVLDVEQRAEVLADGLGTPRCRCPPRSARPAPAPSAPDHGRAVDDDPQHPADRLAPQLHVEQLEPVTRDDALGQWPDSLQTGVPPPRTRDPQKQKKWAQSPLTAFRYRRATREDTTAARVRSSATHRPGARRPASDGTVQDAARLRPVPAAAAPRGRSPGRRRSRRARGRPGGSASGSQSVK